MRFNVKLPEASIMTVFAPRKKVKEKSSSSYYITARIFQIKPEHEVKRTSEWKRSCKDCILVSFGGQFGIHA